jgi:FdhD protein
MTARKQFDGVRYDGGDAEGVRDWLSVEEPLQININGKPFTITMRTPGDDPFLVKGLLFTEGVVMPDGLGYEFESHEDPKNPGNTIAAIQVPPMFVCDQLLEKRSLLSNASCGICGKRELDDIRLDGEALQPERTLDTSLLPDMADRMRADQSSFNQTGGCHAAAIFTNEGDLLALFEDVGRHNAVDKSIGYLLEKKQIAVADLLFVSGRISFEIVSKAFRAGIPYLAAVSAPSSLAVQMAEQCGMSVLGFCRGKRATVYSNQGNVQEG